MASAQVLASEEARKTAHISLVAAVANTYYALWADRGNGRPGSLMVSIAHHLREWMREAYRRRQRLMYDELRVVTGLQVQPPEGAFYLFPRYDAPIGSIELVGYLRSHGLAAEAVAVAGTHPLEALLAEAAAMPARMLVMGAYGHSGLRNLFRGSKTEKLLTASPCAVFVAH